MMLLVTYDVDFTNESGAKRLRKVAKICEKYGVRVQNSVFEVLVGTGDYVKMKNEIGCVIDKEKDSVRFYNLGKKWESKLEVLGLEKGFNQEDTLML